MFEEIVNQQPPESPAPRTAAERDLERVAIALSMCTYPRRLFSRLADAEIRDLTDRAQIALNLGDQQALDTALADATLTLANQHPQLVRDLVVAGAFASTVIAAWLTSMSQRGGR